MTLWRLAVAAVLLLVIGFPLAQPVVELFRSGAAAGWDETNLLEVFTNTLLLIGGTLSIALPLGTAAAVLLFRTDLPFRRALQALTVAALFVPLPLLTSAWQAALGSNGWLPVVLWEDRPGQPWTSGLGPAIWLHGLAAIPWVTLVVGQGLCWVEAELEEDALLIANPWRALWLVTLPRCRAALGVAAVWVALQTAGEITVVDMMLVPTFAGAVHTQFTLGRGAQAVLISLPGVLAGFFLLLWLVPRLERAVPPLAVLVQRPRLFRLGPWRWPSWGLVVALASFLALVPLASLLWKAGLEGAPRAWSPERAWHSLLLQWQLYGGRVARNLAWAALAGVIAAVLALVSAWVADKGRWFRWILLLVTVAALVFPGSVAGIGLKEAINHLTQWAPGLSDVMEERIAWFQERFLTPMLYTNPSSPVPIVWAHLLRFFPYALALLWPVVRMVPQELRDAARLEGARPRQELAHVIWPLTWRAWAWTALVVAALSLGEVAASIRVTIPGSDTFPKLLFEPMHYGVENDVAGLCLVLLAQLALATIVVAGGVWIGRRWIKKPGFLKKPGF